MGNQEQQFYSSEQYPSSPQPSYQYYQPTANINADPREQQQQEMYGGPEYYTRGEKLQPRPPRRKKFRALWLLPVALLFVMGMSYGLFSSRDRGEPHFGSKFGSSDYKQVIDVGVTPKIIINDNAGTIHIHSNEDSTNDRTVTIHTDQNRRGDSETATTTVFDKATGTITITAPQQGFGDRSYNIDITTPKVSDVQLVDGHGNIDIENITGTISAKTAKGRINAQDVSGQVAFSSTNGDVSLENGSLSGQSSLHSDNGDIRYDGSIDQKGNYKFDTINGSVDVRLPDNSAFHLDEHTNGPFNNEFGSNDVGSNPRPSLTISSENGSIHLSKNG